MKDYDIILVDGSSYLFRAYHALPPLENAEGMPTGAIFGVLNMINKLQLSYVNAKIIVVFDPKGGSFRNEMYEEYKADRGETPDDLVVQIPILQEIIVKMGLPLLVKDGYEADDVIASLAKLAKGKRVLISTLDKDLAQLVTEDVHLINTMHNKLLDIDGVVDKFGVRPDQMRDYLSLIGDRSDNVPGISGVGPKTAAKWLGLYDNIEGIKRHRQQIKGKVGEKFRAEEGQLVLSQQLISLVEDIFLAEDIDDIKGQSMDRAVLQEWFARLGFKKWLSEMQKEQVVPYSVLATSRAKDKVLSLVESSETIFLAYDVHAHGISLVLNDTCFVAHEEHGDVVGFIRDLMPLFEGKLLVCHDVKKFLSMLYKYGIEPSACRFFDLMLALYVIDSSDGPDLNTAAMKYLDGGIVHKDDNLVVSLAKSAFNIHGLYESANAALKIDENKYLFHEIEMPLMRVLSEMEVCGAYIDGRALNEYSKELLAELKQLEEDVCGLVDESFNLSSPKQLAAVLFDKLKLPVVSKTPGGDPSTAESVLHTLREAHPCIPLLIRYRTLSKIRSTYAEALPKLADDSGRVHCQFNQSVTITGRLSSTNPNLQNVPIRTNEGRRIRQSFVAPKGYRLVSADYSQIELRIMAHYSKDESLLNAFAKGEDIHIATAAAVDGVDISSVTQDQRRQAKAVNFGLIYGMGAFGLSKQLGIDRSAAQGLIDRYFEKYPSVLNCMNSVRSQAEKDGFVTTLLGRKMYIAAAKSKNSIEKNAAMRAAINAPMQGSAAEIIKLAMLQIHEKMSQFDYNMTIQVHDELVFEVKEEQVDLFMKQVKEIMEKVIELLVPLEVNVSSGDNWESAH